MRRLLVVIAFACLASTTATGQTVFYLNFDEAGAGPYIDGASYTPGLSEQVIPGAAGLGSATFTFRNNAGDGATIGAAPGGLAGTAQGGNVLLVDSGAGQDEGLQLAVDNGLAPTQDFTMEVVWFTDNASGGTNTAGIQSMCGDEWPFGEVSQFFIRTVGASRFDYWSDRGDSNSEKVDGAPAVANTWYHDVLVYDHNPADATNSTILAYRDGVLVGTSVYNAAAGQSVALFGTALGSNRTLAIGFHNSLDANFGDHRGLSGGVDAFALTLGALGPGSFVLPSGTPLSVDQWQQY